ncbi:hypothetical protein BN1723_008676 [Verticillium longisporum]|uniref:LAA1-like C-terminal TPR repeats domain-containing protein n=1 Tax=Verticillium longisporum TaxID=100787 RepID=A0A0G4KHT4_VERLO|nr:hypothetical protein BN1723_008676 [Verticillium longisporum]
MTEEAILLIRSALNALVDAAEVFPSIIKTDLHACIIHIFATTLAAPSCQEVIVAQSLPTLKRFITSVSGSRKPVNEGEASATDVQLQGCLRRFLSIYLNAQKREASTSLACVKNCLLAITILFTGGTNHLGANEPLVARYLDELVDCLTDRMTAKIAANCIRSLFLQPNPTPADQSLARYLLPRLVAFVTNTDPEDPERARALVAQTLTQTRARGCWSWRTPYQESWLKLVDAIASLIEQDSEFVFDALDGKEVDGLATNGSGKGPDINYRDEPVAFFFVLFGIAFEALATRPGQTDSLATQEQNLAILRALKKILHPRVSGHAIYRDAIFSETMDLLDRLVLTEGLDVQGVIVEIARALCVSHPSARKKNAADDGNLSDDIEQLFELTRIIVLVLSAAIGIHIGRRTMHKVEGRRVL